MVMEKCLKSADWNTSKSNTRNRNPGTICIEIAYQHSLRQYRTSHSDAAPAYVATGHRIGSTLVARSYMAGTRKDSGRTKSCVISGHRMLAHEQYLRTCGWTVW
eukprot:581170-Rhodomonas_salina.1